MTLNQLRAHLHSISQDLAECLVVLNYLDSNSLGTLSEILFVELLKQRGLEDCKHTGASQSLTDFTVEDFHISLKTTDSKKPVGLGSDQKAINTHRIEIVNKELTFLGLENNILLTNLKRHLSVEAYQIIEDRYRAVVDKLTGSDDRHILVWVEKVLKDRQINTIKIHTINFCPFDLEDTYRTGYLYKTKTTWGFREASGTILTQADRSGKLLNITPQYLRTKSDCPTTVEIPSKRFPNIQKTVSQSILTNLKQTYKTHILHED